MSDIHPKGSPSSDVWVIVDEPYAQDKDKGFLFSAGYGYMFHKMMHEAGLDDYYVISRRPELENRKSIVVIENELNFYKPPVIIPLEGVGRFLCRELEKKYSDKDPDDDNSESDIQKWAGSILQSPALKYPHYIIPSFAPDTVVKDWSMRDVVVNLDLGKAHSEVDYFRRYGKLNPLPERELKYELGFEELIWILESHFLNTKLISTDIETIYTTQTGTLKEYFPHPGYPVTIGMADSSDFGISFELFWPERNKTVKLWRLLAKILWEIPQLGQNFFNFDSYHLEALGFRLDLTRCKDTLIRHHILWPELPHKLQFLTRQYTREPYYKDEGHGWNMKDMKKLKRYNCLDVTVTYEVYECQEEEFKERPHLI